ncbi:mannan polymerase ii complex anp1 subunit [Lichtheimia corymbifera JMRC:FSU:9682]|uniref:Mannan polymerase ii complex anp1 subunit n=1 Tax=Lichtheimia corymbifera JMRC:FSU:9682 TaxID=1263082 RepID=A0A068RIN6_9FUNG|nr:mannan polymerase ii complex anp1 subunit [Lichtheimia corymbifera JMRC:FSU:9682]
MDKLKKNLPTPRSKRRVFIVCIATFLISLLLLVPISHMSCEPLPERQDGLPDALEAASRRPFDGVSFENLNKPSTDNHVLILTMINPSTVRYLADFFKTVRKLEHPNLSMALLIINPGPTTVHAVRQHIEHTRVAFPVKLYVKTYEDSIMSFILTPGKETVYELQPLRRAAIARARNFLLQSALESKHQYTLWLDPLLAWFPSTLVQDLIAVDEDIVVPNTMIQREGNEWGHDKRNWQETELSISLSKEVPEDFIFMEGWLEFTTHRFLMIDMTEMENKVPLDGIGSTCILTRASVHREGINFPAFPFRHHIDTEGFAKAAAAAGYTVYGLPGYKIYHTGIPDNGLHEDNL